MTEKKLSRRDAMKVLGAAVGAAALSTLPSKWNTPELAAGVLPAHAAQSGGGSSLVLAENGSAVEGDISLAFSSGTFTAQVTDPADYGLALRYDLTIFIGAGTLTGVLSDTLPSDVTTGVMTTPLIGWSGFVATDMLDFKITYASGSHTYKYRFL